MAVAGIWTNAGQGLIVDLIDSATRSGVSATFYLMTGSGSTAAAVTDTALVSENAETRVACAISQQASGQTCRFTATVTYTGARACEEVGVFSASTGGTLVGRGVFPIVNVQSGDEITWDIDLAFADASE